MGVVYWRPVFNLLEEQCEVLVVNAYHAKAVSGRKTNVKDAEFPCRGSTRKALFL